MVAHLAAAVARVARIARHVLPLAVLSLAALPFPGAAWAQPAAALPALPERHDTLTVAFDGAVIGRGILTWVRRDLEQLQVYEWTSAADGSRVIDSLFTDPRTLLPIREIRIVGDSVHRVHFASDTIFLTVTAGGRSVTSHAVAPAVPIHSSAAIEMLAATMPLERGATRRVFAFYAPPSRLGARATLLRVEAPEVVEGRPAWRVTADTPGGGTTFWVDAATRTVLRMDVREGNGHVTFRRLPAARPSPAPRDAHHRRR